LSAIISLVIGYLIGICLAALTIKSDSFLNYKLAFESVNISLGTFNTVLFWTFVFTGSIILNRIISLSRLDVIDAKNPVEKNPFWKKYYIDIFLLIAGIAGNVFFFYMMFNPMMMVDLGPLVFILMILTLLLMPFPFFLLFGGIMTLSRLVSPLVTLVAHKFWKKSANLFSYAMTTMIRQKQSAIRTILLISVVFALIWATFTIPPVLLMNNERTTYYSVGADAYYDNDWNSTVVETLFASNENFTDLMAVGYANMDFFGNDLDVLIIQPNFLEVAYYEESFGSITAIGELFKDNHSVMMNEKGLEDSNHDVGGVLKLQSEGEISLNIVGSFTYFPRLVKQVADYWDYYEDPKVVMSNSTLTELYNKSVLNEFQTINMGYYLKLSPTANITALKNDFGEKMRIASYEMEQARNSLGWRIMWLHLNVLFLVNMITIALTIILYGYKQVHGRARELSVERSLGMKQLQISRLFFFESSILIGFSYLFGSILGFLFSTSIVSILIMGSAHYAIPPPVIFFPLVDIHKVIFLLIAGGLAASIIPAYLARKQDITKSLKVN